MRVFTLIFFTHLSIFSLQCQNCLKLINAVENIYEDKPEVDSLMILIDEVCFIDGIDESTQALAWRAKANLYSYLSDFVKAHESSLKYHDLIKKQFNEESLEFAKAEAYLALTYIQTRRPKESLKYAISARPILERNKESNMDDYLNCLMIEGLCNVYTNNDDRGLEIFNEILDLVKVSENIQPDHYFSVINNIGYVYKKFGDYKKTVPYFQESLEKRKEAYGENKDYALALNNLASLNHALGEYEKSIALSKECSAVYSKISGKDGFGYSTSLLNTGGYYNDLGMYGEAEKYLLEAKNKLYESVGSVSTGYFRCLLALADVNFHQNKMEKAKLYTNEAIDILPQMEADSLYLAGWVNSSRAEISWGEKDYANAEKYFLDARQNYLDCYQGDHPDISIQENYLGNLYLETKDYIKAEEYLTSALEIRKNLLGENHRFYTQSLQSMVNLYQKQERYDEALVYLGEANDNLSHQILEIFDFTTKREKQAFLDGMKKSFNQYLSFQFNSPKNYTLANEVLYNNQLLIKGILLENEKNLLDFAQNVQDKEIQKDFKEWKELKNALAVEMKKPALRQRLSVDSLKLVSDNYERKLMARSKAFSSYKENKNLQYEDIQMALKEDEVAIEFVHFKNSTSGIEEIEYAALVLKKTGTPQFVRLYSEEKNKKIELSESQILVLLTMDINSPVEETLLASMILKPCMISYGNL